MRQGGSAGIENSPKRLYDTNSKSIDFTGNHFPQLPHSVQQAITLKEINPALSVLIEG